jgi:hypothetical protein
MKTKHHLIMALMNAGLDEKRAVYIAGKAFAEPRDGKPAGPPPREYVKILHDRIVVEHKAIETEKHALHQALQSWDNERANGN